MVRFQASTTVVWTVSHFVAGMGAQRADWKVGRKVV